MLLKSRNVLCGRMIYLLLLDLKSCLKETYSLMVIDTCYESMVINEFKVVETCFKWKFRFIKETYAKRCIHMYVLSYISCLKI